MAAINGYPKISIITASYNQGNFIGQTITSVLDQHYHNLEYIIIDGGSTDHTIDIISHYEDQITYWVSEKDRGQSDAINKGFKMATGEIINWLNSDDYYEEGAIKKVVSQFENSTINCYAGISRIFGGEKEYYSKGTDVYENNLAKTIGWARIDQPETFFRKKVFEEIGLLNDNLHYVMDKDLWIRYLCKYGLSGVKKDKQLLVHFRHHGNSKTVSHKKKFEIETVSLYYSYASLLSLDDICEKMKSLWPLEELTLKYKPEGLSTEEWKKVFNYFFLYKGLEAYANNEYALARKILINVKKDILSVEDKAELKKVLDRMKYLPVTLKKILNTFR